jgi:hypothetical protein
MSEYADYGRAGLMLFVIAAVCTGASLALPGGTLPAAALLIGGAGCLIGGVFATALAKKKALDDAAAGLLFAQPTICISQCAADLGVRGDACFVPGAEGVLQCVLASAGVPPVTIVPGDGERGIWLVPSSAPLMDALVREYGLVLPGEEEEIFGAIREVVTDVLDIADQATAERSGDVVRVTLAGFRLIEGCRHVRRASSKCCTMNPCPVCSLIACMLAAGLARPVAIDGISVENGTRTIRLFLSYPLPSGGAT